MTAEHHVFSSSDTDAVEARMCEDVGTASLVGASASMELEFVIAAAFLVNRLSFAGSVRVTAELPRLTTITSSGAYRWSAAGEQGDARAGPLMIRPGGTMSAAYSDTELTAWTFDGASLEAGARAYFADDSLRVRFDRATAVDARSGLVYRRLLDYAAACLPLLADSELLQSTLSRTMTAGVLQCFALVGDTEARRASVGSQHDGYRRARAFIDDHASLPITIEDIAVAASLSVPQLEAAFRSFSPTETSAHDELTRVRLAAAHRDLVDADPTSGDTVRAIALRWGFTPGGLARLHRAAYGVTPKWVLDR